LFIKVRRQPNTHQQVLTHGRLGVRYAVRAPDVNADAACPYGGHHLVPGGDQLAKKPIAGERAGAGEQDANRLISPADFLLFSLPDRRAVFVIRDAAFVVFVARKLRSN